MRKNRSFVGNCTSIPRSFLLPSPPSKKNRKKKERGENGWKELVSDATIKKLEGPWNSLPQSIIPPVYDFQSFNLAVCVKASGTKWTMIIDPILLFFRVAGVCSLAGCLGIRKKPPRLHNINWFFYCTFLQAIPYYIYIYIKEGRQKTGWLKISACIEETWPLVTVLTTI